MSKKFDLNLLYAFISGILAIYIFLIPSARADKNPIEILELSSGYLVAESQGQHTMRILGLEKMDLDSDGQITRKRIYDI